MVEITGINDRDSLREWLMDQNREVSIWIARRAAMRVLPFYWRWIAESAFARKRDLTVLPILRFNLISEVARTMPTSDIMAARSAASASAFAASADFADSAFAAAASAASAASASADSAAADSAFAADFAFASAASAASASADSADFAFAAARSAVWVAIQRDCESVAGADKTKITEVALDRLPLWPNGENPLQAEWDSLKAALPKSSPAHSDETARGPVAVDWGFWIKWYDSVLAGKPLNGDMLVEIAQIKDADWKKGEARISFLIGEIEQRYAVKASPYPEQLSYDGEYRSTPASDLPSATLQDARERIADVASDMRTSGNQYAALQGEADLLDDYLKRYPERAIRLFEICHKVVGHISAHVENGVLPENDNLIGDVLGDLQNSADDIYNFDALVRETVDARAKLRFGALDQEQRDGIKGFAEAVAQNSEAGLAGELREDTAEVMDEQDPEGESKPARYRLGSRLARVLAMCGAGLVAVIGTLAGVEPAISGAQYLWVFAKALIGF